MHRHVMLVHQLAGAVVRHSHACVNGYSMQREDGKVHGVRVLLLAYLR